MMLFMWLFWIVLILLVAWGAFRLLGRRRRAPEPNLDARRDSPAEILERRYADGEISTEEYEERRRKLNE